MIDFFTSLVECNGRLLVPQTAAAPMPTRNTAADLQLFRRGEAPSDERSTYPSHNMHALTSMSTKLEILLCPGFSRPVLKGAAPELQILTIVAQARLVGSTEQST